MKTYTDLELAGITQSDIAKLSAPARMQLARTEGLLRKVDQMVAQAAKIENDHQNLRKDLKVLEESKKAEIEMIEARKKNGWTQ